VDVGIGFLYVVAVLMDGVGETLYVVMGVIAHLMPLGKDTLIKLRIFTYIVAHHEESGLHPEFLESVEDERGSLGDGTIVKGQIDCLIVTVHSPIGLRVEPAEIDSWLLNKHILFLYSPKVPPFDW
jgi:hypothetical protein